jgi:ribonuclease R
MAKKERQNLGRLKKKDIYVLLLEFFEQNAGRKLNIKSIFSALYAKNHPTKMLILDVLSELVFDDYIATDGQGNYYSATRSQVIEGVFQRKRNGRNSFLPDDGGKSILVCERNSMGALDGDRVRVTMLARRRSHTREAEVIEILQRAHDTFVGELRVERNFGFLLTEGRYLASDIFIPKEKLKGGLSGDKAVVKIIEWPTDARSPIGKVVDILGRKGENNAEMHAILAEYGLPYEYPKNVEEAAERLDATITAEEIARREDFRHVTTFTIDPRDAKDFDDALSVRKVEGGWEVGVHIADVSHYVKEGDIIDREAQKRATSVYLVDRTIPMLPERLCNFICSLRPNEEKLAYSAIFCLNEKGEVLKWHLAHTVICSDRRFTYEEAQYIIERHGEASPEDLSQPGEHPEPLPGADLAAAVLRLQDRAR